MLEFKFQNEKGTIYLHRKPCKVLSVLGLGLPERKFEKVQYADSHGQETLSVTDEPRTITVSLDLIMKEGLGRELSRMSKILYYPGKFMVRSEGKTRLISCRCTEWEEVERTPVFAKIVLQFVCDDPAFLEEHERKKAVFERIDKINSPFLLPMVFTERTTEKDIFNSGDLPIQPIFIIKSLQKGTEGIRIINTDPFGKEQTFSLTVPLEKDEELCINFPERRVESNLRGNMIHLISDDTFLHSFVLEQGCNHIKVIPGVGGDLSVICRFTPKYLEGIY